MRIKLSYLEIGSRPLRRNRTEDNREGSEEVWLVVVVGAAANDRVIERSAILPELDFKMLAIFVVVWTLSAKTTTPLFSFFRVHQFSFLLVNFRLIKLKP